MGCSEGPGFELEGGRELRTGRSPFFGRHVNDEGASSIRTRATLGEMTVGLNRSEKAVVIEEVAAKVASAKSIVLAQYRGLEVGHITGLRVSARKSGVYLRVLKNSLARRAVADSPFSGLADQMVGPLIYGISDDPVAAAKVLSEFAKGNDKLVVTAGSLPNSVIDAAGVKALATMPSRDELLAKLMGTMQAPIAQFMRTLNEVPAKFVRTLAAVRDQKEGTAA
jgi:large subunit ribosomal protein L10